MLREAAKREWVVYSKRPFAGPWQMLAYLSRYTHRVAIGKGRILRSDGEQVVFSYKDYADEAKRKTMSVTTAEFIRRFCLHVLPERFVKIRHFGLIVNRCRHQRLAKARASLGTRVQSVAPPELRERAPICEKARSCPFCEATEVVLVKRIDPERQRRSSVRLDSS